MTNEKRAVELLNHLLNKKYVNIPGQGWFSYLDLSLLQEEPPRHIPLRIYLRLVGSILYDRIFQNLAGFLITCGAVVAAVLAIARPEHILWLTLLATLLIFLIIVMWSAAKHGLRDILLLRSGRVVKAEVVRVRPSHQGEQNGTKGGAYLDFIIQVEQRRLSAGSIHISDEAEAHRLKERGHVLVLCLPYVPGSWYLLEPTAPGVVLHSELASQSEVPPGHDHP